MSEASDNSAVSAIVLAAGMSRRMGMPKQLLRAGEKTLLELTLESVRNSCVGEIVLVLGYEVEQIRRQVLIEGIKTVVNEAYQEGMASSLRVGVAAVDPKTQAALIVLADQPFVRPATLDRLIEHHRRFRPQIVIPTYRGFRGNPVLLDRSVFAEIANLRGDIGCRAISGNHTESIVRLEVDDPGILLDVDTREDLEKLAAYPNAELARLAELETRNPHHVIEASDAQPELVVVGRDPVAQALLQLARMLGFTTTVVDPFLTLADVPEASRILHELNFSRLPQNRDRCIVVASRGQFDEDALEQALQSEAVYIGLLANKQRSQELRERLRRKGTSLERLAQLRAPAGLEFGAKEPQEIALSIMAEIVAERSRRKQESV